MPLALTSRKSLKDNEEALKTHLANNEKSLCETFTVEFDFDDIITICNDSWVTNSCGSIFYKDVVGNLAKNMDKVFKFENGDLQIHFRPKITNTNDVNLFKLETIIPEPGVYTLMTLLNMSNEQKMKDNLAAVTKAMKSKVDRTIDEASLESVYPNVQ